MPFGPFDDWLDVDDGGAVNGFKVLHFDPAIAFYFQDKGSMQTDGIGAIRGTSCKHALDRVPHIIARVNLENRALRLMEPGEDTNFFAGLNAVQGLNKRWTDFQVSIRRAFPSLTRRFGNLPERRMTLTDRGDGE